jgi:hypothetical protein
MTPEVERLRADLVRLCREVDRYYDRALTAEKACTSVDGKELIETRNALVDARLELGEAYARILDQDREIQRLRKVISVACAR